MEGRTLSQVGINQNCTTRIREHCSREELANREFAFEELPLLQDDAKVDACKRRPCCKLKNTCVRPEWPRQKHVPKAAG
jgi:hypothetical protein